MVAQAVPQERHELPAGAQGEATGLVNARYGNVASVLFYTLVSDQRRV